MGIIFSEDSGVVDSVFGKCQGPIKMFLEQRGEAFEQNSLLKHMFCMGKSENFGDLLTTMTAMEGFEPVPENGSYPEDSMQEGFSKWLVYKEWKDSFAISQAMVEDARLMDMKKKPAAFMTAYGRTRERFGAALYGGAIQGVKSVKFGSMNFDTTSADGLSVFNTAHPPKVKGNKQCNMFSDAFSVDALNKMETDMQNFRGDNDEILDVAPDTIMIPNIATLKKEVFAAIGADKDPTTANNAFNYQFGRWNVIINPYLNKHVAAGIAPWILLDSRYNEEYGGAVWNDRIPLSVKSVIDENDANRWKGRARFNAGFNDWRFAALGGVATGKELVG